jgi:hypothetical protein
MQYLTFAGVKIIMGGLLGKPLMRTFGQLGLTTFSNLANFIVSKRCAGTQTWRWWRGWGRNGGEEAGGMVAAAVGRPVVAVRLWNTC